MTDIKGIYEVAVAVNDLSKAESFYCGVLGLEVGIRDENRKWLFLRAGGHAGMLVLQETKDEFAKQHFAFTIEESEIERSAEKLKEQGVEIEGPVFHEWMPAYSLYFSDPDGHDLELCAVAGKNT